MDEQQQLRKTLDKQAVYIKELVGDSAMYSGELTKLEAALRRYKEESVGLLKSIKESRSGGHTACVGDIVSTRFGYHGVVSKVYVEYHTDKEVEYVDIITDRLGSTHCPRVKVSDVTIKHYSRGWEHA